MTFQDGMSRGELQRWQPTADWFGMVPFGNKLQKYILQVQLAAGRSGECSLQTVTLTLEYKIQVVATPPKPAEYRQGLVWTRSDSQVRASK